MNPRKPMPRMPFSPGRQNFVEPQKEMKSYESFFPTRVLLYK